MKKFCLDVSAADGRKATILPEAMQALGYVQVDKPEDADLLLVGRNFLAEINADGRYRAGSLNLVPLTEKDPKTGLVPFILITVSNLTEEARVVANNKGLGQAAWSPKVADMTTRIREVLEMHYS